jgi:hypothetical protein
MAVVTFDDLVPGKGGAAQTKAGGVTFDDLIPKKPPQKSVGASLAESFMDVPREIGHEFMESSRALERDETSPAGTDDLPLAAGITPRAGKIALDVLGQVGAPLTGLATSVVGRPVETVTGIPRQTTGNLVSAAVPFVGEAGAAMSAARMARELGVPIRTAQMILDTQKARAVTVSAAKRAAANPGLARNVRSLQQLGIQPSLAVASTGRGTRGAAQSLGGNWFIGGPVRQAINRTAKGFQKASEAAAGGAAQPAKAGERVQAAIDRFANAPRSVKAAIASRKPETQIAAGSAVRSLPSQKIGFGTKAENLYGRAQAMFPQGSTAPMTETQGALADLMNKFRHEGLSKQFANPALAELTEHLKSSEGRLSFDDARRLRTEIRTRLMNDPELRTKINDAEINQLYDAMSRDLKSAAAKLGGPQGAKAWDDADKFYRAGQARIDNALSRYYGPKATPSSVFHDLLGAAQGGARQDLERLNQVRRSLPPEEWSQLQGSIIDRMGRALPGQASEETPFSMRTFLTNVNKLEAPGTSPKYRESGLRVLFGKPGELGATTETEETVRNLRHVASEWRELEKFENKSRSGDHAGNIVVGGSLVSGAAMQHPLSAAIGLLAGNGASALLGDPSFVRWLAGIPKNGSTAETQSTIREMSKWLPTAAGAERQATQ